MKRFLIGLVALSCFGCAEAALLVDTALIPPYPLIWGVPWGALGAPGEPKRMTMEEVCDPTRDKSEDIPAFVALCPTAPAPSASTEGTATAAP